MNAGIESTDYITSAFRLQKYENGNWIDIDGVEGNTINKVHRSVTPFKAIVFAYRSIRVNRKGLLYVFLSLLCMVVKWVQWALNIQFL